MNIKAVYDQTITKAVRDDNGKVIGWEPTTNHYTFGQVGSPIAGGFYLLVGVEPPREITLIIDKELADMWEIDECLVEALPVDIGLEENV